MKDQQGFIAFSTVLIIMVTTLIIASTVAYLAIGEIQSAFALYKGEDTVQFVEGCMEDALLKARASSTFGDPVGTPVNITRPEGTCVITVVSKTGSNPTVWTMKATTLSTQYVRTIQVIFDRSVTVITLTSWKEL